MNSFLRFFDFVKQSAAEVFTSMKIYLPALVALIILGNVETLLTFSGIKEESGLFIVLTIVATIFQFVIISQVVLIEKRKRRGQGSLTFIVPTFLLYNLYYSFLFFIGLLFLIVPGIYALVFFAMVPFIAVLDDQAEGQFFKKSRELVKIDIGLVAWASFINLLSELTGLLMNPIEDPVTKAIATFIFSLPDAFLTVILTMGTVKIYYYLKERQTAQI